jgi:hypothetical protein
MRLKRHIHKYEYIGTSNYKLHGSPYLYACKCGDEKWGEELSHPNKKGKK